MNAMHLDMRSGLKGRYSLAQAAVPLRDEGLGIILDSAVCLAKSLESLVLQGFAGLTRGTLQVQLRKPAKPFAIRAYKISSKQTAESRFISCFLTNLD